MNLINLLKNMKYLTKNNLKKQNFIKFEDLNIILDNLINYEISMSREIIEKPKIISEKQTIKELITTEKSFCRFGDGELSLIENKDIPFQTANIDLSKKLKDILTSNNENIMIGINYFYYYQDLHNLLEPCKQFYRRYINNSRDVQNKYIDTTNVYYSAEISQLYHFFETYDFERYFEEIKQIWENKNITIICGENVFKHIKNNIFDCAKTIEYIYAPAKNAFNSYENILSKTTNINKDRLIIIILGPTATVLAYELAQLGYRAIDFGHIAKDYDSFKKQELRNIDNINRFFNPD